MIKVALIQLICPHYRVPVFRRLAECVGLTVYFGRDRGIGALRNAQRISGFRHKRLWSFNLYIPWGDKYYYLGWFPTLVFHMLKEKPKVIISDGTSNFINNLFLLLYAKLSHTPLILWEAGRKVNTPRNILRRLVDPIIKFLIRNADAFIAYGTIAKEYLISLGVPSERIFIAQNTVDVDPILEEVKKYEENKQPLIEERKRLNFENKKLILFVGAIDKRKKLDNLISAFREIKRENPSVALLIVGDGVDRHRLETCVREDRIKDVHFLGRVVDGVGVYFSLCDVFVLPGWNSLATNQAMAYGKPVITVPTGGPEYELVKHGETGFIVDEDDIHELKRAILRILRDRDLRERMGKNAQEMVKKFDLENMIRGMISAIVSVISGSSRENFKEKLIRKEKPCIR